MLQRQFVWMLAVGWFFMLNTAHEGMTATKSASPAPTKQTEAEPTPQGEPAPKVAKVEGFRSARFAMTEHQVLEAIRTDFGVAKDNAAREVNPIDKTLGVSIQVPDLLPGSGPAQVAYIFGYKSKKLIQVSILWGTLANPKPDASALTTAASLLRNYFAQQGFRNDKMVMNGRFDDGTLLVFRGTDEKGRMVLLLLNTPRDQVDAEAEKAQTQAVPMREPSLQLLYIENVNSPDIFKIKEGQF